MPFDLLLVQSHHLGFDIHGLHDLESLGQLAEALGEVPAGRASPGDRLARLRARAGA